MIDSTVAHRRLARLAFAGLVLELALAASNGFATASAAGWTSRTTGHGTPPWNQSSSLVGVMAESFAGRLLLAAPSLNDPNFIRTVVLVGVHNEEGAMGVVLNRPSPVTVGEAVPQLGATVGEEDPVFVGGPVQPTSIVFLAEFLDPDPGGLLVLGRIGFPAPDAAIDELADRTARRRVFAGYAGWGQGQLDEELSGGDWIALDGRPRDVFTESPETLWSEVLTRNGGRYALIARMPLDPSVN